MGQQDAAPIKVSILKDWGLALTLMANHYVTCGHVGCSLRAGTELGDRCSAIRTVWVKAMGNVDTTVQVPKAIVLTYWHGVRWVRD